MNQQPVIVLSGGFSHLHRHEQDRCAASERWQLCHTVVLRNRLELRCDDKALRRVQNIIFQYNINDINNGFNLNIH